MDPYAFPNFGGSDFERSILLQEPGAAYGRFVGQQQGRGKNFLDYLLRSQNRYYQGYQSDAARQPTASFLDYLTGATQSGADPFKDYTDLSPTDRGERPQASMGRVKFVGL
ncbi:MAG: hypothetical protein HYX52_05730 [Chloroflexi bacterium]|nr:hypothetical protein [Chloroflexota bacterium]